MEITFPQYNFKFRQLGKTSAIFDIVRKKYVALTPEEWVRQHWIHFLIYAKDVPPGLISVEKTLMVFSRSRRYDLVVYNRDAKPRLLIECKAPEIKIQQKVFEQASRYNLELKAPFLLVTNGTEAHCCQINFDSGEYHFLDNVPAFQQL